MRMHTIDRTRMPLSDRLLVAGTVCSVSTNCQEVIDALSVWRCRNGDELGPSFQLNVLVDQCTRRNDGAPHFRGLEHLVFASFSESELFVFDLSRRTVFGLVSRKTAEDASFWRNLLLPISIGVVGPAIGVVPVHAACVDWKGKGLMIAGASGAGKSTLAVALSQRGFSLVSDDWTYVAQHNGSLTAYGVFAPVKLLADASRLFPQLESFRPAKSLNGEMAFEIDAKSVFAANVRPQSNPRWLVFLERTEEARCRITRIQGETMKAFFEKNIEKLPERLSKTAERRSQTISKLAKTDCWLLRYGGPPQVAAEALRQFCEGT
jgi:HPr Serine kinase C-terminal domain